MISGPHWISTGNRIANEPSFVGKRRFIGALVSRVDLDNSSTNYGQIN